MTFVITCWTPPLPPLYQGISCCRFRPSFFLLKINPRYSGDELPPCGISESTLSSSTSSRSTLYLSFSFWTSWEIRTLVHSLVSESVTFNLSVKFEPRALRIVLFRLLRHCTESACTSETVPVLLFHAIFRNRAKGKVYFCFWKLKDIPNLFRNLISI